MQLRFFILIFMFATLTACEKFALLTTPKKTSIASQNKLATLSEERFWATLHAGDYQHIPDVTKLMTAAYLQNPNDPELAAHLGFLHLWKITERNREKTIPSTIVNEIILSKKYFADAIQLNPNDARTVGFLGDTTLIEGDIFKDDREKVEGYFIVKDAIHKWPEFNYFTAGYVMSDEDPTSDQFKEGLDWQWKTMDLCAQTSISPKDPNFAPYMHLETHSGPKRACFNSWIAPHNFEGFFLNMGDMLVKNGEWETAIKIYNNAKLSKDYAAWPYRFLLEKRIANAKRNVQLFNQKEKRLPDDKMLFSSGYGCVVCHQK